jgi:hypothetical protein
MKGHFLEVICGCGARRVIGIGVMAKNPNVRRMTLASVALGLQCEGCRTGPDEVHLCATIAGTERDSEHAGADPVWSLLLYRRHGAGGSGSYWLRRGSGIGGTG